MPPTKRTRTKVFISYSHTDEKWLKRLTIHLKPLVRDSEIDIWDDTRIQPSEDWRAKIETAIASAGVAVILVSADLLASDFVAEYELPRLLTAAAEGGARILPLIISPSRFTVSNLARFQAVNDPSRPLITMTEGEQEATLVKATYAIESALSTGQMREDLQVMSDNITELFLLTMSGPMYDNLKKLTHPQGFGEYVMQEGLKRELYHLRDIGYIDVHAIGAIPRTGPDLSRHVKVTEAGRRFVELREQMHPSS